MAAQGRTPFLVAGHGIVTLARTGCPLSPRDNIDLNPHRVSRTLMNDLLACIRHEDVATSGLLLEKQLHSVRWRFLVKDSFGREINVVEKVVYCGLCVEE